VRAPPRPDLRATLAVAGIASVYLAVNAAYVAHVGVRLGGDSGRYIAGGARILGRSLSEGPPGYRGYEGIIALSQLVGFGVTGVVALQILVATAALGALYRVGEALFDARAGVLAALLYALNPDIARWHSFVLTDSLYTSGLVLTVSVVSQSASSTSTRYHFCALGILLATAALRPEGVVLFLVVAGYWLARHLGRFLKRRRALAAVGIIGGASLAAFAFAPAVRYGADFATDRSLVERGTVVWGYDGWRVPMPVDTRTGGGATRGVASYAARHPGAYLTLALARVGAELAHVRPFYSARHNVLVLAFLLSLYALAAVGLARAHDRSLARLVVLVMAAHVAVVGVTFADWDGRFLVHILPLLTALAAVGLASLVAPPLTRGASQVLVVQT
jgi:4-amino-4-deoxy-L-arabinose transferase-like glycosyltransferase